MAYSIKQKWVWVAIPKNASSSIERTLVDGMHHIKDFSYTGPKHEFLWETKEKLSLIGEDIDNFFKFAIVRNPFDRVISQYFYCKKVRGYRKDFDHFVKEHFKIKERTPRQLMNFISQVRWLSNEKGLCMDFIGRFENLPADLKKICNKFKIPFTLFHERATRHNHYSEYYSSESKKIITNWYEEDLKKFNYQFKEDR
jgi:hypothetical protein